MKADEIIKNISSRNNTSIKDVILIKTFRLFFFGELHMNNFNF
jgi:hypothetical protein